MLSPELKDSIDLAMRAILVLLAVGQIVTGWAVWAMRKEFARCSDCAKRKEGCDLERKRIETDVLTLQSNMSALPSATEWADMRVGIEGLRGDYKQLLAEIKGQSELLKRIERPLGLLMEHHIKGEK